MAFKPKIRYNSSISMEENLKAVINWLNFSLREMTAGRVLQNKNDVEKTTEIITAQLGNQTNNLQAAEQYRKALQLFASSLSEEQALEVATVFETWESGKIYAVDTYLIYGENSVGDPQLYKVVKDHTSAEEWPPDIEESLYTAIGLDDSGYPVWSQPTGAHDAYNTGDIVNYNGVLYGSLIDGNVYSPEAYPEGWKVVE